MDMFLNDQKSAEFYFDGTALDDKSEH